MKLLSIQVGKPKEVEWRGKQIRTGIFKEPVDGPARIGFLGIEGDGQADLTAHGGRDKAVYAYSWDTLAWWRERRPNDPFEFGAFGENLSIASLVEADLCIGDEFQLGAARLQVTEPRFPCFKLGIKFHDQRIIETFYASGRHGVYFRVLVEGEISIGDEMTLVARDPDRVPLMEIVRAIREAPDRSRIERILGAKRLSKNWRDYFSEQLNKT